MFRKEFLAGARAGMPVCVGYFSVSFGFGAMALAQGLTVWQAVLKLPEANTITRVQFLFRH